MTDQHQAGDTTRKGTAGPQQGFDRERMILTLIGLAGAAVIVAININ